MIPKTGKNVPIEHKMHQMVKKYPEMSVKYSEMAIKYINIFQSKALQNLPNLGIVA
jgi:hypothetical protein